MPRISTRYNTRVIPEVIHTGHLSSEPDMLRASLDGPGISVSTDPDFWRQAAGLNGPDIYLYRSDAHFVDVMAFTPEERREIEVWALRNRHITRCSYWVVDYFDETLEDFVEFRSTSREAAAAKVGRSVEDEVKAALTHSNACDVVDGYQLRPAAMKKLGRWPDPLNWEAAIVMIYVREVAMVKMPQIVGIWWDEAPSQEDASGPRGLIFPEALSAFEVETPEGDILPFASAFPEIHLPERRTIIDAENEDRLQHLIDLLPKRTPSL